MEYLSTREAAAYLGYTYYTFKRYVSEKKITPDLRVGWALGFTTATLDAFKASRKPPSRRSVPTLTADQWAEVGRRYHAGETARALATEYGVRYETLHRKVGARKKAGG